MMDRRVLLTVLTSTLVVDVSSREPDRQDPAAFRIETVGVLVTVIVRDQAGRIVNDLAREDFTTLENGEPQTITSFRAAGVPDEGGTASGDHIETRPSAGPGQAETPPVVALVFDGLSAEGRSLAHTAALAYIDEPA